MAKLRVGTRLKSVVCTTEVMVVAAPDADTEICCGGSPMVDHAAQSPAGATLSPDAAGGTKLGKRYVTEAADLELLCTKPGDGSLAAGGVPMRVKEAKPLPSSD